MKVRAVKIFGRAIVASIFIALSWQCTEIPTTPLVENQRPITRLAIEPVRTVQPSQVHLHWYGDDPDGFVVGFLFSWDQQQWYFTRRRDSVFQLPVRQADSVFQFFVAAVDNSVQSYPPADTLVAVAFYDVNNNGLRDSTEEFIGLEGAVDLTPATVQYRVANTPPKIFWGPDSTAAAAQLMHLPDTTFPVATFVFSAYDFDGQQTLAAIEWALNDSSENANWHQLPPTQTMLTLRQEDGLKLNAPNVLYLRAVDNGGLRSAILRYPPVDRIWYVKKPAGPILIVEDATDPRARSFYQTALDTLAGGKYAGRCEVLNIRIREGRFPRALPRLLNPMFLETLKLFDLVIWYGDIGASLEIPQSVIPSYLQSGGKVLFSMSLPTLPTPEVRQKVLDFAPIDSISSQEVFSSPTVFRPGDTLQRSSVALAEGFPLLVKGRGNVVGIHRLFPLPTARILYRLPPKPDYEGTPPVGIQSLVYHQIFLNFPLHAFRNGATLLRKVVVEEFQVP